MNKSYFFSSFNILPIAFSLFYWEHISLSIHTISSLKILNCVSCLLLDFFLLNLVKYPLSDIWRCKIKKTLESKLFLKVISILLSISFWIFSRFFYNKLKFKFKNLNKTIKIQTKSLATTFTKIGNLFFLPQFRFVI
jgi:hypothetical protein